MTDNLNLWEKLGKTDPSHTKKFKRAGGFEGTAIKPMWSYKRMTEEFGPCGTGWGINEPSFQVVPGENREVLVYCTVSVWYGDGKTVFGVGGDKVVTHIKANEKYNRPERWESDDEAFKKAFTDAVTNALKMIGVGADVHMGLFDDNKYVNTITKEFEEEAKKPKSISAAEQKRQLDAIDQDLVDAHGESDVKRLVEIWASIAERDGWSKDYWDAAMRKFKARREELRAGASSDFPGDRVTDEEARRHPMNAA